MVSEGLSLKPRIVAESGAMRRVLEEVAALAAVDPVAVLIRGESGTGKELLARLLHHESPRAHRAFVALNAAALPDTLLEAELFGHARGAFTGAEHPRKGLLEEADGGTLFLDEVADLSARAQVVLLRALQEREYRRVGESSLRRSDFRVVTATHKDLDLEVRARRFRHDLRFRLDVARVEVPPLRERPQDIVPLARRCLEIWARRLAIPRLAMDPEAEGDLLTHPWPGNVRELENEITQAVIRAREGAVIRPEHLSIRRRNDRSPGYRALSLVFEKNLLAQTLACHGGNRTRAARALGLSRQGLYRKLKRHGFLERTNEELESGRVLI
jgi:transcriptional regulator with PAS, ATPase and Fis domain